MDEGKGVSGRIFFWVFFLLGILGVLVIAAFHIKLSTVTGSAPMFSVPPWVSDNVKEHFFPAVIAAFGIGILLLWIILTSSVRRKIVQKTEKKAVQKTKGDAAAIRAEEKEKKIQNDKRLFLHLISVLQKEGRLMDFFSEDLEQYEDDQIGAAVRGIHASCLKTMNKYIKFDAILSAEEDEEITIEPDFDPASVKLTGNVAGNPPFKGIVRHRGWKTSRVDLPTLSGGDPEVISPAEVEII